MKIVEAQYYAYHPYAKDYKFKEHKGVQSKKETESLNNKKRGNESQEGKPKKIQRFVQHVIPVERVTMRMFHLNPG